MVYYASEDLARDSVPLSKNSVGRFKFDAAPHADLRGLGRANYALYRESYPSLGRALLTGFVVGSWTLLERHRNAARHFDAASLLGRPFNIQPGTYVRLMSLEEIAPGLRITIDQPSWLFRDGLLTLSLWLNEDRMFTLSFVIGYEKKALVAYVGGLQGRNEEGALDLYRELTKAAHGIRPRDLLVELFRILCAEAGIEAIYATSRRTHYYRGFYYRFFKRAEAFPLDYDSCWSERGGILLRDRLFRLEPGLHLRDPSDVPAKKRAMYRKRRSLMVDLRLRLATALAFPEELEIKPHGCGSHASNAHPDQSDAAITPGPVRATWAQPVIAHRSLWANFI